MSDDEKRAVVAWSALVLKSYAYLDLWVNIMFDSPTRASECSTACDRVPGTILCSGFPARDNTCVRLLACGQTSSVPFTAFCITNAIISLSIAVVVQRLCKILESMSSRAQVVALFSKDWDTSISGSSETVPFIKFTWSISSDVTLSWSEPS